MGGMCDQISSPPPWCVPPTPPPVCADVSPRVVGVMGVVGGGGCKRNPTTVVVWVCKQVPPAVHALRATSTHTLVDGCEGVMEGGGGDDFYLFFYAWKKGWREKEGRDVGGILCGGAEGKGERDGGEEITEWDLIENNEWKSIVKNKQE